MEENYGCDEGSGKASDAESLNLSFSSSSFEDSNAEENEGQGDIHPYQFEPYAAVADDESGDEGEGLNAPPEEDVENRLNSTDW